MVTKKPSASVYTVPTTGLRIYAIVFKNVDVLLVHTLWNTDAVAF